MDEWRSELPANWKRESVVAALLVGGFLLAFFLPVEGLPLPGFLAQSLALAKWYAREHVILCLVPAFFIAGAISVFVSSVSVMKHLGPGANRIVAYGVASVSGSILAVCSCTVLPLFAGIYKRGAGLGPATAFLYSGPAVNVLAIVLTARVLGVEFGVARALGAVVFSIVLGLAMHVIFRRDEAERAAVAMDTPDDEPERPLWQAAAFFVTMVGLLVFANWSKPAMPVGLWHTIHSWKWVMTAAFAAALGITLILWYGVTWWKVALTAAPVALLAALVPDRPMIPFAAGAIGLSIITVSGGEGSASAEWFESSWGFAKQIVPLLFAGVLVAGALLGSPGGEGLVPRSWVAQCVGGNSLGANLFASLAGALMYFATLTEVPILDSLLSKGMGNGPALALLLAGPSLSLPSMLALRGIMGGKKTFTYVALVVAAATVTGLIYGAITS